MAHVRVAFENARHTTAWHLVRALEQMGHRVTPVGPGHPANSTSRTAPLIWVESGRPVFPPALLASAPPPSVGWVIDSHRAGRWRARVGDVFGANATAQRPADSAPGKPHWVPLAAPMDLAHPSQPLRDRPYDIAFVGQAPAGSQRARVLAALDNEFRVLRANSLTPQEMMSAYGSARVVLNIPLAGELNMRTFEAAASRAMLLCSPTRDIDRVLPPDGYVVVDDDDVHSWAEALRSILSSENQQSTADSMFEHVRDHHSYSARAEVLLGLVTPANTSEKRRIHRALLTYVELGEPEEVSTVPASSALRASSRFAATASRRARILARRLPTSLRRLISPQF